jgi:ABC-type Fe3+/spermidine/putrescine transport system ATPase subunit
MRRKTASIIADSFRIEWRSGTTISVLTASPSEARFGMVFGNYALFHLTVFDNVAFGLRCSGGLRTRSKRVEEMLGLVRLSRI